MNELLAALSQMTRAVGQQAYAEASDLEQNWEGSDTGYGASERLTAIGGELYEIAARMDVIRMSEE